MIGSVMFFEAESVEAVRKIVESDIYYTGGVVRLTFPSSTIPSISFFDFDLVGQGTNLYLTFCTGDALAVELEDTAMAGTVIVVIVTHPRSQYHHSPKVAFGVVTHMFVRYLMILTSSNVKLFVTLPAAIQSAQAPLNLLRRILFSFAYIPQRSCLDSRIMTPQYSAWCTRLYLES